MGQDKLIPPLAPEAAGIITGSEQILKDYASASSLTATDIKRLIEDVLHNPPPSPMQHYPAPRNSIACFLCDVPDWSVLDKQALDKAISQLPVPLPGPVPAGISIQDALQVRTP